MTQTQLDLLEVLTSYNNLINTDPASRHVEEIKGLLFHFIKKASYEVNRIEAEELQKLKNKIGL